MGLRHLLGNGWGEICRVRNPLSLPVARSVSRERVMLREHVMSWGHVPRPLTMQEPLMVQDLETAQKFGCIAAYCQLTDFLYGHTLMYGHEPASTNANASV